jgi:formylglycine-generating enzyme required for sulfatase activity
MRGRTILVLRAMVMLLLIAARSDVGSAAGVPADMVLIPAGPFLMGATPEAQQAILAFGWHGPMRNRIHFLVEHSGPQHTVHLDEFYIDRQEVTNQAYRAFVDASGHQAPTFWNSPRHLADPVQPVVGVSWYDAQAFCAWQGKRLPTEAEWEKAARGTDGRRYPWGQEWDATRLHTADAIAGKPLESFAAWTRWQHTISAGIGTARPAAGGSYPQGASPYAVLDMAGNVWEWVADWYDPEYYMASPARNPTGPATGDTKVLRGGGWDVPQTIPVTWLREQFIPPEFAGSPVTGFRCAATTSPGWHTVQRQRPLPE